MYTVPTQEPASVTAGDSAIWTKTIPEFPTSEGWALQYFLLQDNGTGFGSFQATVGNGMFSINVPPAQTSTWIPANYRLQGQVSLGGELHTVYDGRILVCPGLSANPGDTRSHARIIFDNIEAIMAGRATDDILDSSINGTTFRRLPVEQLILLHDRYKTIVQQEEAAARIRNGKGTGRNVLVRIGTPGGTPGSPYWPYGLGLGGVGAYKP